MLLALYLYDRNGDETDAHLYDAPPGYAYLLTGPHSLGGLQITIYNADDTTHTTDTHDLPPDGGFKLVEQRDVPDGEVATRILEERGV